MTIPFFSKLNTVGTEVLSKLSKITESINNGINILTPVMLLGSSMLLAQFENAADSQPLQVLLLLMGI